MLDASNILVAMAAPDSGVSPWVQLVPFALVLGIFYFIILTPMKKKQQKVQDLLDSLKGGVHLVLQVHTDDARRLETETTMERMREELGKKGVTFSNLAVGSPTDFRIDGVPREQDQALRQIAAEITDANFNREPGVNG